MSVRKFIKIKGLYVGLYREAPVMGGRAVLFGRRLVEPAWIELWFKATEKEWDDTLWEQISDDNKDWFSYCYHLTNQPDNKFLEIAISKKFKKIQQRLVLLEGMIMAGNINKELVSEINEILDSLVKSDQLPKKQASRMKKRIERSFTLLTESTSAVS